MDDVRLAAIRDSVQLNFDETAALLGRISAGDLHKTAANGWAVGQLAGHVAVSPSSALYVLKRLQAGRNATVPGFLSWAPAVRNWFIVRRYKSASTEDMLQTATSARAELLEWVSGINADDLAREGEVFGTGRTSVGGFLDYVLVHGREHRGEIEAAIS